MVQNSQLIAFHLIFEKKKSHQFSKGIVSNQTCFQSKFSSIPCVIFLLYERKINALITFWKNFTAKPPWFYGPSQSVAPHSFFSDTCRNSLSFLSNKI